MAPPTTAPHTTAPLISETGSPELARRLVAEYCPPGGLVLDPMCGIGTSLVEAAGLGRRAVGVELEPRWAELARANLAHALPPEQAGLAEVRQGDARRLAELLADLVGGGPASRCVPRTPSTTPVTRPTWAGPATRAGEPGSLKCWPAAARFCVRWAAGDGDQ